jgi:hypothetical protein
VRTKETGTTAVSMLDEMCTRPFQGTGVFSGQSLEKNPFAFQMHFMNTKAALKK